MRRILYTQELSFEIRIRGIILKKLFCIRKLTRSFEMFSGNTEYDSSLGYKIYRVRLPMFTLFICSEESPFKFDMETRHVMDTKFIFYFVVFLT